MVNYILYLLIILLILSITYLIIKKYINTYEPFVGANLIETTKDGNDVFYSLKPSNKDCFTLEISDNLIDINNAKIVKNLEYNNNDDLNNKLKEYIKSYDFYEISETGNTKNVTLYELKNNQALNLNSDDPNNSSCKKIDTNKETKIKQSDLLLKPKLSASHIPKKQENQYMKLVNIPAWPINIDETFNATITMFTNNNAITGWGFDLSYDHHSLELTDYNFEDNVKESFALNDNRNKGIFNAINVNEYLEPQINTTLVTLTFKVKSTANNIFKITGIISSMPLINGSNYFERKKHEGNAVPFKHQEYRGSFNAYSELKLSPTTRTTTTGFRLDEPGIFVYPSLDVGGNIPVHTINSGDLFYLQVYGNTGGENMDSFRIFLATNDDVCHPVPKTGTFSDTFVGDISGDIDRTYSYEDLKRQKDLRKNKYWILYARQNRVFGSTGTPLNSPHGFLGYIRMHAVGSGECLLSTSYIEGASKPGGTAYITGIDPNHPITLFGTYIHTNQEEITDGFTNIKPSNSIFSFLNDIYNLFGYKENFQGNFNFRSTTNINSESNTNINFAATGTTNSLSLVVDGTELIADNKNRIPFNVYESVSTQAPAPSPAPAPAQAPAPASTSGTTSSTGWTGDINFKDMFRGFVPTSRFAQVPEFTPPTIPGFASTPGFAVNPGFTAVPHVNSQYTINYMQQNPEQFLGNNISPAMAYYNCNNN